MLHLTDIPLTLHSYCEFCHYADNPALNGLVKVKSATLNTKH